MNSRTRLRCSWWLVKLLRAWRKPLLIVLVLLGSFRSAVADWNDVPTGSMKPTILEGDRIFVNKLAYGLRVPFVGWRLIAGGTPVAGEIVVFDSPESGKRLIKRVVAVGGDIVQIHKGQLVVNGTREALAEDPRIGNIG